MLKRHIPDVLPWLAYCFCGYAAFSVAYKLWNGSYPEQARCLMTFLKKIQTLAKKIERGSSSWTPIAFSIFCVLLLIGAGINMASAPIAEEHNISVIERLGNNEWKMCSDEEGCFIYRACEDFNNADVIWAGYVADRAKWREYGKCKSIRETGLGFYWREGHSEYRRTK